MFLSLLIAAGDGLMDGAVEIEGIGEGAISEIVLLEIAPTPFDVVELGGVFCCAALRVGSHSTRSQGRSVRALAVTLLVWIGP